MLYQSTRNSEIKISSAKAITLGISEDGGLFVPQNLPKLSQSDLDFLVDKSYVERAKFVFSKFLTDFTEDEIAHCVENAYNDKKFASENIYEMSKLGNDTYMLELWHGKTCAFKDMALQILPYLLTVSAKKEVNDKKIIILVATSGDTGKAALEGFKDVEGTEILVFYPENGVSAMQKRQMTTQEGENVYVCAIKGNFDDAQTGVKNIFTDESIQNKLEENKMMFSSANSINWGRLLPQVVYYVSAYCDMVKNEEIKMGDGINICVPTGNFGNILAAYYAKQMGMPFNKLICASNKNKVLTDFINTGIYDKNREFSATISPSMDILVSSNLERLLYELTDRDDTIISDWFNKLSDNGKYEISDKVKAKLSEDFVGGFCDDDSTKTQISKTFSEYSYLLDTHTAVALNVYEEYKSLSGDETKTLVVSTANPYKFTADVLSALTDEIPADEYAQVDALFNITKLAPPQELTNLKDKTVRFTKSIDKADMDKAVFEMFNI